MFYFFIPFLMMRHLFISNLGEEEPFYWQFWRGGPRFIGYLREEACFYRVYPEGGWWGFLFMSKTMLEVGWKFILWSMLFLEGWSSRSSYFIGVALYLKKPFSLSFAHYLYTYQMKNTYPMKSTYLLIFKTCNSFIHNPLVITQIAVFPDTYEWQQHFCS